METNPLTLIVKEKTLGNLVTNAKDIKAYVAEKLKEYSVENCESVKDAANKKAEINNAIKTLNDRRIALEKEWNLPFQEFKEIISETTGMMKTVSGNLDAIVKEQENREKEAKKKQKIVTLKEVKLRPHIEDHDFYVKMKNASKFLGEGNKVKVTIMFRGRELSHPELGMAVLTRFAEELKETASIEKAAKLEGRNMTMILVSK